MRKFPVIAASVLSVTMAGHSPAMAQNNTAPFATGTKCGDLVEPRRSACNDAFDPRTNAREWQQRQHPGAILPPKPSGLGRAPATLAPKDPYQPNRTLTPALPRFRLPD